MLGVRNNVQELFKVIGGGHFFGGLKSGYTEFGFGRGTGEIDERGEGRGPIANFEDFEEIDAGIFAHLGSGGILGDQIIKVGSIGGRANIESLHVGLSDALFFGVRSHDRIEKQGDVALGEFDFLWIIGRARIKRCGDFDKAGHSGFFGSFAEQNNSCNEDADDEEGGNDSLGSSAHSCFHRDGDSWCFFGWSGGRFCWYYSWSYCENRSFHRFWSSFF